MYYFTKVLYLLILFYNNCVSSNKVHQVFFYNEQKLEKLFNTSLCITVDNVPSPHSAEDADKPTAPEHSSMALIHDLATYNKIEYYYTIKSEEGPSHSKWYTVILQLGNPGWDLRSEQYTGYGSKIKDAQKNAAKNALLETSFHQKPPTDNYKDLNVNDCNGQNKPSCQLYTLLKDTDRQILYKKSRPDRSDMYGVQVLLDHHTFKGEAFTVSDAKEMAAEKVLEYLAEEDKDVCDVNDIPENDDDIECSAIKSPVSILYEIAQKYSYQVKFTVAGEQGPPHKKIFTMVCKMADFESIGEDRSKKLARVKASESMLEILSKLDYPTSFRTQQEKKVVKKHRKKRSNKLERTTSIDNKKTETNPIVVLYQWAAANGDGEEPVFTFEDVTDSEGMHKRFKANCFFRGLNTSGLGNKKKVSKQNAALGMLNLLHIPYSDEITRKDSLIDRTYVPGLLKAPDYLLKAGMSAENEVYETRSTKLAKLNKKLKRAAEHFAAKETSQINETLIEEIMVKYKNNPTQQLEDFLNKIEVQQQYINLPMHHDGAFSSVIWLFTIPELLCYGRTGQTLLEAQENTALATLTFLAELSLTVNNMTSDAAENNN